MVFRLRSSGHRSEMHAQQIVGPEPREASFASSLFRLSCSVTPWPGQLRRWASISRFVMNTAGKKIELADHAQTDAREREIQLLINIVEPDPEYQDPLATDEASLLDAVGVDQATMTQRLKEHFGADFDLPLQLPLWKLVDAIKTRHPDWPGSFE